MFDRSQSRDKFDLFVAVNQEGGNNEVGGTVEPLGVECGVHEGENESRGSGHEFRGSEESMYAAAIDEEFDDTSMLLVSSDDDPMHAALGIAHRREELENYTDVRFSKQKYMRAYGHCIHPIPDPSFWLEKIDVTPINFKPPTIKRMPGRPKKSRRKEPEEVPGAVRRANVLKCKICNDIGHNRTCPNKDDRHQKEQKKDIGKFIVSTIIHKYGGINARINISAIGQDMFSATSSTKKACSKEAKASSRTSTNTPCNKSFQDCCIFSAFPSSLLLTPSFFRSIRAPSDVGQFPNEPKNNPTDCP
ncbi:hypothetical protein Salat_1205500 [Sesamum alatum]|uniref:Uncharacterized protein n=1 Tax=Sesamum alatum TaxID=300844 RepID=A0AAE1YF11_9LAMI|nr:hypothetical protein Salat_1205500 [Sesamum alatum]